MEAAAPAALSPWHPVAPGSGLPPPGKSLSPPGDHRSGNREGATPAESSSSGQHSLFSGFASMVAAAGADSAGSSAGGHGPAAPSAHAAHADATSAAQLRNLQRLYGNLAHMHNHSSRTSLPDIAEEEPSPVQPGSGSDGSSGAGAQRQLSATSTSSISAGAPAGLSGGSRQNLAAAGKPASKVMSEEDIFAMAGGLELAGAASSGTPGEPAGSGQGGGLVAGAPPLAYDLSLVGQMPAGQSQSRTLFVRNVDASVTDEELHVVFEAFGEINSIYTACKHRGFVVISYFDIRAATLANHTLQGQALKGHALEVHFSLPKDEKESRQGTVLVVAMDSSLGQQELAFLFSQFGDVKGIEQDPARPNCSLVEFFDVRHAAAAVQGVSQSPELANRLVVMEAAGAGAGTLPLGAGASGQQAQQQSGAGQEQLLGSSLPSDLMAGFQPPGAMKSVGSSPALLQQLHYGSQGSFGAGPAPPTAAASSQLDLASYLFNSGMAGPGGSMSVGNLALQQQAQQQAAAAAALMSAAGSSVGDVAGMARSFSELSLQQDLNRVGMMGPGGAPVQPPSGRLGAGTMSTGDLLNLQQQQQGGQGLGRGVGPLGLRGIASTGSIWSSATQQVFPNNPASLGSSPVSSAPWLGALGALGGSSSALQEALAAQQAALQQQAVNAALLQNAAAVQAAAASGGPLAGQSAAMQVALQQALLNQQAAALLQSGALGMGQPGAYMQQRLPQRMEPPLGGRLARRPLDPQAEAERRAQQDKLYSLDIGRIRSGEDKRTTLMIKNIPNKYTQKMLLALIEERFRGMFDFFYLPIDFKNKCNVGYAFINMVKPEYIIPLVDEFHGKRWPKFNSEKICHIAYGRIQGKAALVQHFQNSSLLHEDKRCRPVLFHTDGVLAGEQEPFPTSATPPL
ncbi:hypothetical protein N2152v2_002119 [Parachlorella kessleri]